MKDGIKITMKHMMGKVINVHVSLFTSQLFCLPFFTYLCRNCTDLGSALYSLCVRGQLVKMLLTLEPHDIFFSKNIGGALL